MDSAFSGMTKTFPSRNDINGKLDIMKTSLLVLTGGTIAMKVSDPAGVVPSPECLI